MFRSITDAFLYRWTQRVVVHRGRCERISFERNSTNRVALWLVERHDWFLWKTSGSVRRVCPTCKRVERHCDGRYHSVECVHFGKNPSNETSTEKEKNSVSPFRNGLIVQITKVPYDIAFGMKNSKEKNLTCLPVQRMVLCVHLSEHGILAN